MWLHCSNEANPKQCGYLTTMNLPHNNETASHKWVNVDNEPASHIQAPPDYLRVSDDEAASDNLSPHIIKQPHFVSIQSGNVNIP